MILILLALAIFVAWEVAWIVYQIWFSPLADVPGPFLARISNLWLAY
jgi:hypothetical protein